MLLEFLDYKEKYFFLLCSIWVKGVVWDGGDKVVVLEVCGGICFLGLLVIMFFVVISLFIVCLMLLSDVWIFCMVELNVLDEFFIWSFSLDIFDFIWGWEVFSVFIFVVIFLLFWMVDIFLFVVIFFCFSWCIFFCSWIKVLMLFFNDVICNFKVVFFFESLFRFVCILLSWFWIFGGIFFGFDGFWWFLVVVGCFVVVEKVGRVVEINGLLMNLNMCDVYLNKIKSIIWYICMLW